MEIVKINRINKSFANKKVLNNISLEVEKGDFFGLIGPNGAGKSTLIQIMCGLIEADSGSVNLFDMDYGSSAIDIKSRYGLVPQELAIFESLTAKDNLDYFGRMYGLKGQLLRDRIDEVMEVIGLEPKDKKKVKNYSGGMKRRLNIGCSILHRPDLLILDEPTVGIDAQSRNNIFDFLRSINDKGTTIIYTSHYMEEVESLCNNIFIMDLGEEVAYGEKSELKAMYGGEITIEIKLSDIKEGLEAEIENISGVTSSRSNGNILLVKANKKDLNFTNLFKVIEGKAISINNISIEESNLEEIFLDITGKKLRD